MSEEEDGEFQLKCSLGNLRLSVSGPDEEWVKETFDEEWQKRLEESEDMSKALRDGSRIHQ